MAEIAEIVEAGNNRSSSSGGGGGGAPTVEAAEATGRVDEARADDANQLRQRYQIGRKLGQGTYGRVQLATCRKTDQKVAIKTIEKRKIESETDLVRVQREINIISSIRHPFIIHIHEVLECGDRIYLVTEFAEGGELYEYLRQAGTLSETEAARLFRQISMAVFYCHHNHICHRDLKLENVLLDRQLNAKIADFGLANVFDAKRRLNTYCGSPLYASPEIVRGSPYVGPEVDCWSLGVLLYTLVYGSMPFDGSNFKRLVCQITTGQYYEPVIKSGASRLISRMLTVDAAQRATIADVCADEWLNSNKSGGEGGASGSSTNERDIVAGSSCLIDAQRLTAQSSSTTNSLTTAKSDVIDGGDVLVDADADASSETPSGGICGLASSRILSCHWLDNDDQDDKAHDNSEMAAVCADGKSQSFEATGDSDDHPLVEDIIVVDGVADVVKNESVSSSSPPVQKQSPLPMSSSSSRSYVKSSVSFTTSSLSSSVQEMPGDADAIAISPATTIRRNDGYHMVNGRRHPLVAVTHIDILNPASTPNAAPDAAATAESDVAVEDQPLSPHLRRRDSKVIQAAKYWNKFIGDMLQRSKPMTVPHGLSNRKEDRAAPSTRVTAAMGVRLSLQDLKTAFEPTAKSAEPEEPATPKPLVCQPGLSVTDARQQIERRQRDVRAASIAERRSSKTKTALAEPSLSDATNLSIIRCNGDVGPSEKPAAASLIEPPRLVQADVCVVDLVDGASELNEELVDQPPACSDSVATSASVSQQLPTVHESALVSSSVVMLASGGAEELRLHEPPDVQKATLVVQQQQPHSLHGPVDVQSTSVVTELCRVHEASLSSWPLPSADAHSQQQQAVRSIPTTTVHYIPIRVIESSVEENTTAAPTAKEEESVVASCQPPSTPSTTRQERGPQQEDTQLPTCYLATVVSMTRNNSPMFSNHPSSNCQDEASPPPVQPQRPQQSPATPCDAVTAAEQATDDAFARLRRQVQSLVGASDDASESGDAAKSGTAGTETCVVERRRRGNSVDPSGLVSPAAVLAMRKAQCKRNSVHIGDSDNSGDGVQSSRFDIDSYRIANSNNKHNDRQSLIDDIRNWAPDSDKMRLSRFSDRLADGMAVNAPRLFAANSVAPPVVHRIDGDGEAGGGGSSSSCCNRRTIPILINGHQPHLPLSPPLLLKSPFDVSIGRSKMGQGGGHDEAIAADAGLVSRFNWRRLSMPERQYRHHHHHPRWMVASPTMRGYDEPLDEEQQQPQHHPHLHQA